MTPQREGYVVGRTPPFYKKKGAASFCKRSDQDGVSFFPEEEGTALGAPQGVSLMS